MYNELHARHAATVFEPKVVQMFTDIIEADESIRKIILFVGKMEKQRKSDDSSIKGVTINEIVDNIQVERKTKVEKKQIYKYEVTNLHRKTAEHLVDKLLNMSLLYYESIKPYKLLFLTNRGLQIIEELLNRNKQKKQEEK